jgi:hypothetical protein
MNASREGLLQPTLGQNAQPAAAPYSVQATFFTGFFGGPFAAIALIVLNSSRLRRLRQDWPALAACVAGVLIAGWALHGTAPAVAPLRDWINTAFGERSYRYVYRLVALLIVGAGYLLHRKEQRNTDLMGLERPNGWVAGGLCTLAGVAVLAGFLALVLRR